MNKAAAGFSVPDHLHASLPVERWGKKRDQVRMMVLDRYSGKVDHDYFNCIGNHIESGDVLVLNQSRTIPASLRGIYKGKSVEIRLARKQSSQVWEVLLLEALPNIGEAITFEDGSTAIIEGVGSEPPLQKVRFSHSSDDFWWFIFTYGKPVYYEYITDPLPLENYQTVYSSTPGSVEMTSAGRAFTWKLLAELEEKGVEILFLNLHTSLSYYGNDQWPNPSRHPESYNIPRRTADQVNLAKNEGRRIIAVGTTVVRALEASVDDHNDVSILEGTTNLYVDQNHRLSIVDGLLTGFHEPEASHLDLLLAFINGTQLLPAYQEAIDQGYLWHEFGDVNLLIGDRAG